MRAGVAAALVAAGSALLLWGLGRPALWQDEAETALRAEAVLETGIPRETVRGVVATAQPSLLPAEETASGVWTWNTWLPAYLAAASFLLLGPAALAARLPFALAAALTLWLAWRVFSDGERDEPAERREWAPEAALALLALSPAYVLFGRQARYYSLAALGTMLALAAWRRLLAGRPWGALGVVAALNLLFHSWFAFCAVVAAALALDALLRLDECLRGRRFWAAAALALLTLGPAAWYFRVWERPGNHDYPLAEALDFLKTFLLWIGAFSVPLALAGAASWRRGLAGFVLLCGLVSEGPASRAAALAAGLWILAEAVRQPAPRGVMNLRRMCLLLLAAGLALLSEFAAEPYGRYLMGLLPALAYLSGRALSRLAGGRARAVAALTAFALASNAASLLPLKAAQALAAPAAPADSVSGMMRARLRDLPPRSDLARVAAEVLRGAEGYVEPVAAAIRAGGGATFFSDADALSLMCVTTLRPVYPDELASAEPDWILPSPWLRLSPADAARVAALAASGRYEAVPVEGPLLLWQNNPDPLVRDFSPRRGPLPLLRRRGL